MSNDVMRRAAAAYEARGDIVQAKQMQEAAQNFEPTEESRALLRSIARRVRGIYDRNLCSLNVKKK